MIQGGVVDTNIKLGTDSGADCIEVFVMSSGDHHDVGERWDGEVKLDEWMKWDKETRIETRKDYLYVFCLANGR